MNDVSFITAAQQQQQRGGGAGEKWVELVIMSRRLEEETKGTVQNREISAGSACQLLHEAAHTCDQIQANTNIAQLTRHLHERGNRTHRASVCVQHGLRTDCLYLNLPPGEH